MDGDGLSMAVSGAGPGIGVQSQRITTDWQYGAVDNECPECLTGSIDLARNGDGRWSIEWYPVPCQARPAQSGYSMLLTVCMLPQILR